MLYVCNSCFFKYSGWEYFFLLCPYRRYFAACVYDVVKVFASEDAYLQYL